MKSTAINQKKSARLFTVINENGEVVVCSGTANDVLEFTNTLFEYDRRDEEDEEETNVWVAIRELKKLGCKVIKVDLRNLLISEK